MTVRDLKEALEEYPDFYGVHVEIVREQGEQSAFVTAVQVRKHDGWMAVVVTGDERCGGSNGPVQDGVRE